jgi:hypothetical protein
MNIIIDLDLQQAVQGFGSRQAASPIQVKSQDTPTVALYFVRGNVTYDLGASPGLRFGVFVAGNPNPLVQQNTFTKTTDNLARTVYVAYPNFNTTAMSAAIGSQPQLSCIGEIRYQTSYGTIARTADIDFTVMQPRLTETVMDNLIAAFTVPAVNANVTARINNTGWLSAGLNISIAAGAGAYQVVSVTNVTDFVAKNLGGASNAASGTTIPSGTAVGIAPVNVLQAYPDPSIIEVTTHKDVLNGYAGLDAGGLLKGTEMPVDGTTIAVSGGKLTVVGGGGGTAGQNAYTHTSASFVVPAVGATVPVAVVSTAWMGGTGYVVFISGAGYYAVSSITDATHAVLTNMGGASNAIAGTTVPSGATVSAAGPAGAAGAAGSPGAALSAYDALASSFVMPAAAVNVTIAIANTAWMATGQVIYIASAGYFQVASITSTTQVAVTNLNYPGNASAGVTIAAGSKVSAGGLIGATGSGGAGKNAFTNLAANFTQPAVNATVSINVGSSAWMAVGQVIFVQGGGYYSVSSITDLTDAIVTNLGYVGNAAPSATVTSGSTVAVTPGGLAGAAGTSAYTVTTASFTQPTTGATVTVTVGNTSWMAQGQNLFIPGAGYYSVSVVTDSTHVVLTNSGTSGNSTAGNNIPSGSQVSPAGSIGPTGATGATGPQGPAGSGGGGGVDMQDPENGIEWTEHFIPLGGGSISNPAVLQLPWMLQSSGAPTLIRVSPSSLATSGSEMSAIGISVPGATGIGDLTLGDYANGLNFCIPIGLGVLTYKAKVAIDNLGVSADAFVDSIGIFRYNVAQGFYGGFFFEYNYAVSANWRCCVRTGTGGTNVTYVDSGVVVAATTWYKFKIVSNAGWTSFAFSINNTLVATITTNVPTVGTDLGVAPHFLMIRSAATAARFINPGYFYLNYPFTN